MQTLIYKELKIKRDKQDSHSGANRHCQSMFISPSSPKIAKAKPPDLFPLSKGC